MDGAKFHWYVVADWLVRTACDREYAGSILAACEDHIYSEFEHESFIFRPQTDVSHH